MIRSCREGLFGSMGGESRSSWKVATEFAKKILSHGGSSEQTLTPEIWKTCYEQRPKKGIYATCSLIDLDVSRSCRTNKPIPEEKLLASAEKIWLEPPSPRFDGPVHVLVQHSTYVLGAIMRLSGDVKVKALVIALHKSFVEEDKVRYEHLLEIAKDIPILLQYQENGVEAWFHSWNKSSGHATEASLEESSVLAHGDSCAMRASSSRQ